MARPSKYNWEVIKEAYEKGFTKDEIVKKFNIPKAILTNKINKEKWVILCDVNADVEGLNVKLEAVAQNYAQNPIIEEMFQDRINTIIEDNELIGNNRKLLKAFQGLVGKGIKEGTYKTPQDIRAGVGAIKDIEAVANPKTNDIKVENNIQNNQITKVEVEFI